MATTKPSSGPETPEGDERALLRAALIGNPNTGKTTLFNRLSGLRHKTGNFPGTTQEARVGYAPSEEGGVEIIDLPGIYSLELDMSESEVCRRVLAGTLAAPGTPLRSPDVVCVVADATNLSRNLLLVGEVLRRRLPTVVVLNMIDLARSRGVHIDLDVLSRELGCTVITTSARKGEGVVAIAPALAVAVIPNQTPPGTQDGLEAWADRVSELACAGAPTGAHDSLTDRIDHVVTHPVWGVLVFAAVMTALFWSIFTAAQIPMALIESIFDGNAELVAAWQPEWLQAMIGEGLSGLARHVLPEGFIADLAAGGIVSGIGATVVFLPQICILFFLISLLEDTGYLARAAFVMDRVLRPLGLPGHSFMPLLSSHACALPGIIACRAIPDRRERLATILVAPFMTCSARLPVYVMMTGILFAGHPLMAALAFVGCYALGIVAACLSALIARRTFLRGPSRAMALELPTYKLPSVRTAAAMTIDRGWMFMKKAGTVILAICIVLWWLGAFPRVEAPTSVQEVRELAQRVRAGDENPAQALSRVVPGFEDEALEAEEAAEVIEARADTLEAADAKARSYIGRMGRTVQPVFAPLGFDWQLSVGVLTSFAAREVFVSTMAVIVTGSEDAEDEGVLSAIAHAKRDDGITPVFTTGVSWAVLVFYVLAMQCLPTLAVTARESGHVKWALLQLVWMSVLAYGAAAITYAVMG
jgi:ferrous iron transport protein B